MGADLQILCRKRTISSAVYRLRVVRACQLLWRGLEAHKGPVQPEKETGKPWSVWEPRAGSTVQKPGLPLAMESGRTHSTSANLGFFFLIIGGVIMNMENSTSWGGVMGSNPGCGDSS